LKDATTQQEKMALVMQFTSAGFELAEKRTKSLAGAILVLQHQFDDAAKNLTIALLPNLTKLVKWTTRLIEKFNNLKPEQQRFIGHLMAIAAAAGPAAYAMGGLTQALIAFKLAQVGIAVRGIAGGLAGGGIASQVPGISALLAADAAKRTAIGAAGIVLPITAATIIVAAATISIMKQQKAFDVGVKGGAMPEGANWFERRAWHAGRAAMFEEEKMGTGAPAMPQWWYEKGQIRRHEELRAQGIHVPGVRFGSRAAELGYRAGQALSSAQDVQFDQLQTLKKILKQLGNGVPVRA
jgi:hypothetical protein